MQKVVHQGARLRQGLSIQSRLLGACVRLWLLRLTLTSLFVTAGTRAAVRPHYGGILRLETSGVISELNPSQDQDDPELTHDLSALVFERLVRLDEHAIPQPQLALSWQHDSELKRWDFTLRPGVKLHDRSDLTAATAATSIQAANPGWRVRADVDHVLIETESPSPVMPAELALVRNSVWAAGRDGQAAGTGPFRIAEWQARTRAVLAAYDDYREGRPYLDQIEISMDRTPVDQLLDLQLGKADVIDVGLDQARRASREGGRVVFSAPCEVLALEFAGVAGRDLPESDERRLRQAIGLSINRVAIQSVLFQNQGEAAGSLLPQWLGGYNFLFPAVTDLALARRLRSEIGLASTAMNASRHQSLPGSRTLAPLPLIYDPRDSQEQLVAERIAINARDAGVGLVPTVASPARAKSNSPAQAAPTDARDASGLPYVRLVRLRLESLDPPTALGELIGELMSLDRQPPQRSEVDALTASLDGARHRIYQCSTPECLYNTERATLADFRLVPLFHLPVAYALSPKVRNWLEPRGGGWPLENVWMEAEEHEAR
jgi:ABC-type transport system substrate-binding protein